MSSFNQAIENITPEIYQNLKLPSRSASGRTAAS